MESLTKMELHKIISSLQNEVKIPLRGPTTVTKISMPASETIKLSVKNWMQDMSAMMHDNNHGKKHPQESNKQGQSWADTQNTPNCHSSP
jgi:hypothetical protein